MDRPRGNGGPGWPRRPLPARSGSLPKELRRHIHQQQQQQHQLQKQQHVAGDADHQLDMSQDSGHSSTTAGITSESTPMTSGRVWGHLRDSGGAASRGQLQKRWSFGSGCRAGPVVANRGHDHTRRVASQSPPPLPPKTSSLRQRPKECRQESEEPLPQDRLGYNCRSGAEQAVALDSYNNSGGRDSGFSHGSSLQTGTSLASSTNSSPFDQQHQHQQQQSMLFKPSPGSGRADPHGIFVPSSAKIGADGQVVQGSDPGGSSSPSSSSSSRHSSARLLRVLPLEDDEGRSSRAEQQVGAYLNTVIASYPEVSNNEPFPAELDFSQVIGHALRQIPTRPSELWTSDPSGPPVGGPGSPPPPPPPPRDPKRRSSCLAVGPAGRPDSPPQVQRASRPLSYSFEGHEGLRPRNRPNGAKPSVVVAGPLQHEEVAVVVRSPAPPPLPVRRRSSASAVNHHPNTSLSNLTLTTNQGGHSSFEGVHMKMGTAGSAGPHHHHHHGLLRTRSTPPLPQQPPHLLKFSSSSSAPSFAPKEYWKSPPYPFVPTTSSSSAPPTSSCGHPLSGRPTTAHSEPPTLNARYPRQASNYSKPMASSPSTLASVDPSVMKAMARYALVQQQQQDQHQPDQQQLQTMHRDQLAAPPTTWTASASPSSTDSGCSPGTILKPQLLPPRTTRVSRGRCPSPPLSAVIEDRHLSSEPLLESPPSASLSTQDDRCSRGVADRVCTPDTGRSRGRVLDNDATAAAGTTRISPGPFFEASGAVVKAIPSVSPMSVTLSLSSSDKDSGCSQSVDLNIKSSRSRRAAAAAAAAAAGKAFESSSGSEVDVIDKAFEDDDGDESLADSSSSPLAAVRDEEEDPGGESGVHLRPGFSSRSGRKMYRNAINEIEDALSLINQDADLLDRAERRDLPTAHQELIARARAKARRAKSASADEEEDEDDDDDDLNSCSEGEAVAAFSDLDNFMNWNTSSSFENLKGVGGWSSPFSDRESSRSRTPSTRRSRVMDKAADDVVVRLCRSVNRKVPVTVNPISNFNHSFLRLQDALRADSSSSDHHHHHHQEHSSDEAAAAGSTGLNQVNKALLGNYGDDTVEPDVYQDDVAVRWARDIRDHTVKVPAVPQPKFGIPLDGEWATRNGAHREDYLRRTPDKGRYRSTFNAMRNPDIVLDDIAFRKLRKDGDTSRDPATLGVVKNSLASSTHSCWKHRLDSSCGKERPGSPEVFYPNKNNPLMVAIAERLRGSAIRGSASRSGSQGPLQVLTYEELVRDPALLRSARLALGLVEEGQPAAEDDGLRSSWTGKTLYELLFGANNDSGPEGPQGDHDAKNMGGVQGRVTTEQHLLAVVDGDDSSTLEARGVASDDTSLNGNASQLHPCIPAEPEGGAKGGPTLQAVPSSSDAQGERLRLQHQRNFECLSAVDQGAQFADQGSTPAITTSLTAIPALTSSCTTDTTYDDASSTTSGPRELAPQSSSPAADRLTHPVPPLDPPPATLTPSIITPRTPETSSSCSGGGGPRSPEVVDCCRQLPAGLWSTTLDLVLEQGHPAFLILLYLAACWAHFRGAMDVVHFIGTILALLSLITALFA